MKESIQSTKLLSPREYQVLRMISNEYTTAEIATILRLSQDTIKSHRKSLLNKFQARNTAGLIRRSFEQGVLQVI